MVTNSKMLKAIQNYFGDKARLQHILDAICEIENYVKGVSIDEFVSNIKTRFYIYINYSFLIKKYYVFGYY